MSGANLAGWLARALGALTSCVLRLQRSTLRADVRELERLDELTRRSRPVLVAFWHGKYFPLFSLLEGRGACIFASDSFRGRVIAEISAHFGYDCILVPGTSGDCALEAMRSVMRRAALCATAADGPLGPARQFKSSLIQLASEFGYTIVPMSVSSSRKRVARHRWDQREIPLLFSQVRLQVGEPVVLPPALTPEDLDGWRKELQERLNELESAREAPRCT